MSISLFYFLLLSISYHSRDFLFRLKAFDIHFVYRIFFRLKRYQVYEYFFVTHVRTRVLYCFAHRTTFRPSSGKEEKSTCHANIVFRVFPTLPLERFSQNLMYKNRYPRSNQSCTFLLIVWKVGQLKLFLSYRNWSSLLILQCELKSYSHACQSHSYNKSTARCPLWHASLPYNYKYQKDETFSLLKCIRPSICVEWVMIIFGLSLT